MTWVTGLRWDGERLPVKAGRLTKGVRGLEGRTEEAGDSGVPATKNEAHRRRDSLMSPVKHAAT